MSRHIASFIIVAVLLVAVLALPACSGGPSGGGTPGGGTSGNGSSGSGATDAKALIRDRCTACHDVSRIKTAQHDAAGWQSTVERMQGKGAEIDATEASTIVEFLAGGGGSSL
jgi:hypothetical protein